MDQPSAARAIGERSTTACSSPVTLGTCTSAAASRAARPRRAPRADLLHASALPSLNHWGGRQFLTQMIDTCATRRGPRSNSASVIVPRCPASASPSDPGQIQGLIGPGIRQESCCASCPARWPRAAGNIASTRSCSYEDVAEGVAGRALLRPDAPLSLARPLAGSRCCSSTSRPPGSRRDPAAVRALVLRHSRPRRRRDLGHTAPRRPARTRLRGHAAGGRTGPLLGQCRSARFCARWRAPRRMSRTTSPAPREP